MNINTNLDIFWAERMVIFSLLMLKGLLRAIGELEEVVCIEYTVNLSVLNCSSVMPQNL